MRLAPWVLSLLEDLRERAEGMRSVDSFVNGAQLLDLLAVEIESRAQSDELLTPQQAEAASGYSPDQLRRMANKGKLTNHGTRTKALYSSAELPRKAGCSTSLLRGARDSCTMAPTRKQIARAVVNQE